VVLAAVTASATPRQDLETANAFFRKGEFGAALPIYNFLLYPEVKLASAEDITDAYVGLGVCYVETGDMERAKREFEKALQVDPNKQLDSLIHGKEAIKLFDDIKTDLRIRAEREAAKKEKAEIEQAIQNLRVYRAQPYFLNFVPFGVGQFQNREVPKGVFFLSAELLTLSTSVGIWAYLVNEYGISSDRVPLEEGPKVRRLQQIEIGAGVLFFALYVLGVVDSHMHYKPTRRVEGDDALIRELRRQRQQKPKTSLLERIHIYPMATSNGAGIGIGWED
jgi:tetratricopeptide (TPR) repeat protein